MRRLIYEVGESGLKRVGGFVFEEFLRELQGFRAARIYREMADNDPVIGGLLFAIEQTLIGATWEIHPANDTPEAEEIAEFYETCREDMSHTWTDMMYEVATFLVHGWAWMESVYKVRRGPQQDDSALRSRFSDGKIGWRKIALRAQDTLYRWEFDEHGGIQQMYQISPPDFQTRIIPIQKSLLFRAKSNRNNPEGRSVLRNAFRPWYFKKRIEEIEGIGVERDLAGLPTLTPPDGFDILAQENAATVAYAKMLIRNIRRDEQEGVLLPNQWKLELLASQGKRDFDTNDIIERYSGEMAISILAQFILLGMRNVGSFALSETQQDLFLMSISGWLKMIADVFNRHEFPRLARLNGFDEDLVPELKPSIVREPKLPDLAAYITSLSNAGLLGSDPSLESYLRALAKLPEPQEQGDQPGEELPEDPSKPPPTVLTGAAKGRGRRPEMVKVWTPAGYRHVFRDRSALPSWLRDTRYTKAKERDAMFGYPPADSEWTREQPESRDEEREIAARQLVHTPTVYGRIPTQLRAKRKLKRRPIRPAAEQFGIHDFIGRPRRRVAAGGR